MKILSVSLAGRFAGFRGLDLINLAITTNARGGPGIVLASVAFDAGIISPKFYTTLVLAAVLTSQVAGAWLDYVLRKGWPLLTPAATSVPAPASAEEEPVRRLTVESIRCGLPLGWCRGQHAHDRWFEGGIGPILLQSPGDAVRWGLGRQTGAPSSIPVNPCARGLPRW